VIGRRFGSFEIACVLVYLDHVASRIENLDHGITRITKRREA
jgi:hypothetical protein